MTSIVIHHVVPIPRSSLLFTFWLPDGRQDAINVSLEDLVIQVWIDRTCVQTAPERLTDEFIAAWTNIPVSQLYVDVRCESIPTDLATFIQENADWPKRKQMLLDIPEPERRLAHEYQNLGLRVLTVVLRVVNRMIAWAYAERGQFWLEERDIDTDKLMMRSRNNEFNTQVSIDTGSLIRWCPPNRDNLVLVVGRDGLHREDWSALGDFLGGHSSPNLVGELLSNAEALLAQGDNRSALIEGVSALEVAFHRFATHPRQDFLRDRYNVLGNPPLDRLKGTVGRFGFSTCVTYLLPLILESLPVDAHIISCEAITERGTVVHSGQRDVTFQKARRFLTGLHQLAGFLESATEPRKPTPSL